MMIRLSFICFGLLFLTHGAYAQSELPHEVIQFIDGLKKPYLIPIDREKMPKRADNISAKAFFVGKNFLKENPNPLYLEFIKEVATALTAYTNTTVTSDSLLGHLIVYGISPEEDPAEMYQPVCEKELKFLWEQMGLSKQPKIAALPVRMDTFYDQLFSQEGKKVIEDAFQLSLTPEKDRPGNDIFLFSSVLKKGRRRAIFHCDHSSAYC
ncbi:MAG: hypothetical protein R3A45_03285 [Bdellovibrionota bacterium]